MQRRRRCEPGDEARACAVVEPGRQSPTDVFTLEDGRATSVTLHQNGGAFPGPRKPQGRGGGR